MERLAELFLPKSERRFLGWFAAGVAVYWAVHVFTSASWPFWVEMIAPGATSDPELLLSFGIVGNVVGAGIVFVLTGLLRLRQAPRWLWIPVGATSLWYTSLALWELLPAAQGGLAASTPSLVVQVAVALLPLVTQLATAFAACLVFGPGDGSLTGDGDEGRTVWLTTTIVVTTTALSQTALFTGLLGGYIVGWNLIVPGLLCLFGTGILRLPKGLWLPVAETSLPMVLMWLTPTFIINAVSGADVSGLIGWELTFAGFVSLSAILGSFFGWALDRAVRGQGFDAA